MILHIYHSFFVWKFLSLILFKRSSSFFSFRSLKISSKVFYWFYILRLTQASESYFFFLYSLVSMRLKVEIKKISDIRYIFFRVYFLWFLFYFFYFESLVGHIVIIDFEKVLKQSFYLYIFSLILIFKKKLGLVKLSHLFQNELQLGGLC